MSATQTVTKPQTISPVLFNTTLHDLFSEGLDGPYTDTLCVIKPNSDLRYGDTVPVNKKYIIHSAQVGSADDLAHLQLEINSYLLMFYAGPMKVVFMGTEGRTEDETLHKPSVEANARRSFAVIDDSQRPKIKTYANIEDYVKNHDGSKIDWAFAVDFAEQLPAVNQPRHVYKLNSKRWLAECPLKSANDAIVDCEIECPHHTTKGNLWYYGGEDCHSCRRGINNEIERVRKILRTRPPYVLKLTQSLSAVGTHIAKSESDRQGVEDYVAQYLHEYLPRITQDNANLYTTTLILSDFIPGSTMALNFFVKRNGSVEFLGACHQQSTGESGRQATAITYADQPKLEEKYQAILGKIGQVLHAEGYYGPVGADIMENPNDGTLFTIDLNVRSPLSFVLYVLRDHLNKKRGFAMSIVYECLMLKISRDELEEKFAKEFREGRIVLMGSTRFGKKQQWAYGVIVAGADQKELQQLSDRILEYEIDGGQGGDVADAAG